MTILPSAYLPSIGYFIELICAADTAVIDQAEHYVKRTLRNRAHIMTAQGVMPLTIPVRNANRPRQPMLSVEIDNSKRWQHQHWIAIKSAYRSSPYYEHYAPFMEPLYQREWVRLIDFNDALLELLIKLLMMGRRGGGSPVILMPQRSAQYIDSNDMDLDLRTKEALTIESLELRQLSVPRYMQVFEDRVPFEPNMSILDMLFCEGPNTLALLMASHI